MLALDPFLKQLLVIAEQAGALIKKFYDQGTRDGLLLAYKKDGSPFTKADQEADLLIQKGLQQLTPHIPIISEEQVPPPLTDPEDLFWIIDPLDGTKGFIERSGEFVINIALIDKRQPILGIIHVPLTGETYIAFKNQAYAIKAGAIELLPPLLLPTEGWDAIIGHSFSETDQTSVKMRQRFPLRHIFQMGSALKFCFFARGKAHFSWRFLPCYEWDTAAPQALIETLGGCFITLEGKPFLYGKPNYLNAEGFFVYASKDCKLISPFP